MPDHGKDPLLVLPPELTLRILALCDLSAVARLERLNTSWKGFISEHQGPIFSAIASRLAPDVIQQRNGVPMRYEEGDLAKIISSKWSPEHLTWGDVKTWREFCRRKLILMRNLDSPTPRLSDRTINTGIVTTWRLRPDFEARTVICTAHQGGLWVYDMDSGRLLWNLLENQVGPHAHLEHSRGTLAFNPGMDDTIEIWRRADLVAAEQSDVEQDDDSKSADDISDSGSSSTTPLRAKYIRIGRLPHSQMLRGWHLLFPTLCVVSNQGKAWIYDVSTTPPQLQRELTIPDGARGHLEQNEEVVMFSMKRDGYQFFNKATGEHLGKLHPSRWAHTKPNYFHIPLANPAPSAVLSARAQDGRDATSSRHGRVRLMHDLREGSPTATRAAQRREQQQQQQQQGQQGQQQQQNPLDDTEWSGPASAEWGAGMLYGNLMIGVSRQGWIMICSDWPQVLREPSAAQQCVAFIDTEPPDDHDRTYDLGGWLTIGGSGRPRACFEVGDHIYVLPLPDPGALPRADENQLPIHAIPGSSDAQLPVPISFMQMGEDHLLATFASVQLTPLENQQVNVGGELFGGAPLPRLTVTKCPRFISFAPWVADEVARKRGGSGEDAETGDNTTTLSDLVGNWGDGAVVQGEEELVDEDEGGGGAGQ